MLKVKGLFEASHVERFPSQLCDQCGDGVFRGVARKTTSAALTASRVAATLKSAFLASAFFTPSDVASLAASVTS